MPHVTIAVIRHSISCANMYHNMAESEDDPLAAAIENIPNPALSKHGRLMCRTYGPVLKGRLEAEGFDFGAALVGGSYLQRATETASLLFPGHRVARVPYLTEAGDVPVNQPDGGFVSSWPDALRYLVGTGARQFVVVSHGNYMRERVWPAVSSEAWRYVGNLDTIVIRGFLTQAGNLLQPKAHRIIYDGRITTETPGDTCKLPRGLAYIRDLARTRKTKQRGGFAPSVMGAFTKVAKPPSITDQNGGFIPSVMGSFAVNGLRLVPLCGYLGYKMFNAVRSTKKRSRR